jgi:hypothetical protein
MILHPGTIQSINTNLISVDNGWLYSSLDVWDPTYTAILTQPISLEAIGLEELRFLSNPTTLTIRQNPLPLSLVLWSGISETIADPISNGSTSASGVSAGTYGDSTDIPVITVNSSGNITNVTLVPISANSSQIANSYYFQNIGWNISGTSSLTNIVPGIIPFGIPDQAPGSIIKIEGSGQISWNSLTDFITFNLTDGSSLLTNFSIAGTNLFASKINTLYTWKLNLEIVPQTSAGTSANVILNGLLKIWDDTTASEFSFNELATVNTTIANTFGNTVQWNNASFNNLLNIEEYRVYQILVNGETVTSITYQIDGGVPNSIYGGTSIIDGGSV